MHAHVPQRGVENCQPEISAEKHEASEAPIDRRQSGSLDSRFGRSRQCSDRSGPETVGRNYRTDGAATAADATRPCLKVYLDPFGAILANGCFREPTSPLYRVGRRPSKEALTNLPSSKGDCHRSATSSRARAMQHEARREIPAPTLTQTRRGAAPKPARTVRRLWRRCRPPERPRPRVAGSLPAPSATAPRPRPARRVPRSAASCCPSA